MSLSIALDPPVVLDEIGTERTNGVSPVDRRVAQAAGELSLAATSIERLPFDLSVAIVRGVLAALPTPEILQSQAVASLSRSLTNADARPALEPNRMAGLER